MAQKAQTVDISTNINKLFENLRNLKITNINKLKIRRAPFLLHNQRAGWARENCCSRVTSADLARKTPNIRSCGEFYVEP
jgi:hypothetical protein